MLGSSDAVTAADFALAGDAQLDHALFSALAPSQIPAAIVENAAGALFHRLNGGDPAHSAIPPDMLPHPRLFPGA
jgi:hypothetical protein